MRYLGIFVLNFSASRTYLPPCANYTLACVFGYSQWWFTTTLDHVFALAGCSLSCCGFFFSLLSCIPVMFTESFSLSQSFSIMVGQRSAVMLIVEIVNVIYGTCDFSLFSITKEMQHKWSVAALLCKITVNWVCSGKCVVTVDCKFKKNWEI